MAQDAPTNTLSGPGEFAGGAALGAATNFLVSLIVWFWDSKGDPSDDSLAWLSAAFISAFVVSLAAVILAGHRPWLVWGVLIGTAVAIPIDLLVFLLSIGS